MLQASILFLISLLFISCSSKELEEPLPPKEVVVMLQEPLHYSAFTHELIEKYDLSHLKIKQLQFYTSHKIILYRDESSINTSVKDGKLFVEDSKNSKKIIIKAYTPAKVLNITDNKIVVSFDDNVTLTFLNPYWKCCKKSGKYYLAADSWSEEVGFLMLNSKQFRAEDESGKSFLLIDKEELQSKSEEVKLLQGLRVN